MFNADDIAQLITWRDSLNFHAKSECLGKIGATRKPITIFSNQRLRGPK
jgi:hypothetical protein